MLHPSTSIGAQKVLCASLNNKAAEELKVLLETKHLYQKVDIRLHKAAGALYKQVVGSQQQDFADWANTELPKQIFVMEPHLNAAARIAAQIKPSLTLILPHLSIFCKVCERREAFAPVWHADLIGEVRAAIAGGLLKKIQLPDGFQMFSLIYQCQRCLQTPESFLVRREGWILSLQGRSPMERIEVPNYIPKSESRFYRDAVIALNSGKTLAGLFYLRTFVEQFARRITGTTGKATGDEILDAYYKTLPAKQADHLPSLREWYDKLSEAIHSAREDAALFEAAKSEIETHFDMRRVFKIAEPKIASAEAVDGDK